MRSFYRTGASPDLCNKANPGQNGTPQAPPNSPLANGSGLKQIGVLKPGAHRFDRLAPTGWGASLTSCYVKIKHMRLTDQH